MTRHWRGIAATAATLAAVVVLVTVYTVRLASARTAAIVQATRTERIQKFMLNMFSGGDETAGPADTLHVVTLLGRGVREARALDLEPAVQAELYGTLGGIYEVLGNFERADTLLRTALDRRRALERPAGPDVAASLIALGALRADQAEYADAQRLVREGLAISSRSPATDRVQGHGTIVLGQVLEDRGVYDSAIVVLQDAVRLQSRPTGDATELGEALSELANSQFYIGHFHRPPLCRPTTSTRGLRASSSVRCSPTNAATRRPRVSSVRATKLSPTGQNPRRHGCPLPGRR